MYTTAKSGIMIAAYLFPCRQDASVELEKLSEICPFCDDEDVQRQLEQLVKTRVSTDKQEKGGKKDEVRKEGKEE